jgi:S1-C subfamily serine protease
MCRFFFLITTVLVGMNVALKPQVVTAQTASQNSVKDVARAVTVEIRLQKSDVVGSGVIIHRQGDRYTLVTNRHVICGSSNCTRPLANEVYTLELADGQKYQASKSTIRLLSSDQNRPLDLAIIQFSSNRNYKVAKVAGIGSLKVTDQVYTAGFPLEYADFAFGEGEAIAVVNQRLTGDNGGYTVVYDASTLPGMSGGGVFNRQGQLVAIHGQGDRFKNNTEINRTSRLGSKIGFNRGIPIRWLTQNLAALGINVGSGAVLRSDKQSVPGSADEHFITGFNKFLDPGQDVVAGKRQAIQKFTKAMQLNPKYANAYYLRAIVYYQLQEGQRSLRDYNQAIALNPNKPNIYYNRAILKNDLLNDIRGAFADYNQAISLNPKQANAYFNRAALKAEKLNDAKGAVADYNQVIAMVPRDAEAYNNRAVLKAEKLNDAPGALADYTKTIALNSKYADAYFNRGILQVNKFNNRAGAIQDLRQAARLYREQGQSQKLEMVNKALRLLNATEN